MHLLSRFAVAALIASIAPPASSHTWPEELQVIGTDGTYVGDRGFPRGYVGRTDPNFDGDVNLWLLPSLEARMPDDGVRLRINSSDLLCNPSQRTSNYANPAYPKLKIAPGESMAIKYLENGHVTLPWTLSGKPLFGGTVFVYGTSQPSPEEKIADVLQWNAEGTGGDKRGSLLSAQTYDDGRCHQINSCVNSAIRQVVYPNKIPDQPTSPGQEQWCESDVSIPDSQQLGGLTLYWIWQWPTAVGEDCTFPDGKDEYYTSCIDVDIVDNVSQAKVANGGAPANVALDNFQTAAVSTYKSRVALTASPSVSLENWGGPLTKRAAAANPAFTQSCSAVLASIAANAGVPPPSCPAGLWATGALFESLSRSVLSSHNTAVFIAPGVSETFPAHAQPSAKPTIPTSSPAAAKGSATAPVPYGAPTETVMSTLIHTKTLTRVVTVTAGDASEPSSPPQISGARPPPGQYRGGRRPHFNTISTIRRRSPAASGRPDMRREHARRFR